MALEIECYSGTNVGLKRENNQDSLLVHLEQKLFLVADGLGGHSSGEVASSMALESVGRFMVNHAQNIAKGTASWTKKPQHIVRKIFEKANEEVLNQSKKHIQLRGMGTTMVMVWMHDSQVYIGNVGDSRVYLFREGCLWQLTDDHSLMTAEMKKGFDHQEMVRRNTQKSVLTQSLGITHRLSVDIVTRDINKGDTYLLCSDGLHGMLSDQMISDILSKEDLKDVPARCIIKACSLGGWDNVTVVAAKIVSC